MVDELSASVAVVAATASEPSTVAPGRVRSFESTGSPNVRGSLSPGTTLSAPALPEAGSPVSALVEAGFVGPAPRVGDSGSRARPNAPGCTAAPAGVVDEIARSNAPPTSVPVVAFALSPSVGAFAPDWTSVARSATAGLRRSASGGAGSWSVVGPVRLNCGGGGSLKSVASAIGSDSMIGAVAASRRSRLSADG